MGTTFLTLTTDIILNIFPKHNKEKTHEFFLLQSIAIRTSDTLSIKKTENLQIPSIFPRKNRQNHFSDFLGTLLIALGISVYFFAY